jgi:predicted hotdog family 3-hydroxylacyl-ACP dehydratase
MSLTHDTLCEMIPHHGSMCLLDSVIEWNETSISCRATSQCERHNPLRQNDVLTAINGVEYAAQAMAVHGALLDRAADKPGVAYLAALRGVTLHCDTLHQYPELILQCQRLGGDSNGFIYTFQVNNDKTVLLEGRATVIKEKEDNA